MNHASTLAELIRPVFQSRSRGVVGVVDDLLEICRDRGLSLEWHAGQCRIGPVELLPDQEIEVPLAKSVFRAVLARLAAPCNEHRPNSVSPYGGVGVLKVGADPSRLCAVAFTNTADQQDVVLTPVEEDDAVAASTRRITSPRARAARIGSLPPAS
jgi:hypothetical protein